MLMLPRNNLLSKSMQRLILVYVVVYLKFEELSFEFGSRDRCGVYWQLVVEHLVCPIFKKKNRQLYRIISIVIRDIRLYQEIH